MGPPVAERLNALGGSLSARRTGAPSAATVWASCVRPCVRSSSGLSQTPSRSLLRTGPFGIPAPARRPARSSSGDSIGLLPDMRRVSLCVTGARASASLRRLPARSGSFGHCGWADRTALGATGSRNSILGGITSGARSRYGIGSRSGVMIPIEPSRLLIATPSSARAPAVKATNAAVPATPKRIMVSAFIPTVPVFCSARRPKVLLRRTCGDIAMPSCSGVPRPLALQHERVIKEADHARNDGRVGHIEHVPGPRADVKMHEIEHGAENNAIKGIARRAADDQRKRQHQNATACAHHPERKANRSRDLHSHERPASDLRVLLEEAVGDALIPDHHQLKKRREDERLPHGQVITIKEVKL